ncbi:hypothetical protein ATANTOWER_015359 [Ataeniobius toweri]|uniref:Restriction endonuclease type IV Mrr domain-containing protein n=1 Tax=Ataeniobius toweri TaxID=208326 RepID=A0ABU7BSY6_9TELE|nr:hypothetical protein [Ataeniobius toweri]
MPVKQLMGEPKDVPVSVWFKFKEHTLRKHNQIALTTSLFGEDAVTECRRLKVSYFSISKVFKIKSGEAQKCKKWFKRKLD